MNVRSLVVDTSVAVKWFLDEPLSPQALHVRKAIQQEGYRPLAPDLIYAEFANVLWKHVRRDRLNVQDCRAMVAMFLTLPFDVIPSISILKRALETALEIGRPVYDALFLALSVESDADMVTADERLYQAVRDRFSRLRWLGDWPVSNG